MIFNTAVPLPYFCCTFLNAKSGSRAISGRFLNVLFFTIGEVFINNSPSKEYRGGGNAWDKQPAMR